MFDLHVHAAPDIWPRLGDDQQILRWYVDAGFSGCVLKGHYDAVRERIPAYSQLLQGKVVVDPSNPIGFDASGQMMRTLPDGESAGSVVAALLPVGAHYVKAFGTLGADALAANAHRNPPAVLFYATDDEAAAKTIERMIRAAGFEPWKAGGVTAAGRIEAPAGDLHQYAFKGEVVDIDRARSATAGSGV